jgi:hypothetical protein
MAQPARSLRQRRADTLLHLELDKDLWVASGDLDGNPYLVPLSFWWNGKYIFISTVEGNQTARNIVETGQVRVALGHTRDVVLVDALAKLVKGEEIRQEYADAYAAKCGWDPRKETKVYQFFRLEPQRVEAWRELNEHPDRELMRDGEWLV